MYVEEYEIRVTGKTEVEDRKQEVGGDVCRHWAVYLDEQGTWRVQSRMESSQ